MEKAGLYTIKEIAEYCKCSKNPVRKQIGRIKPPSQEKYQRGQMVPAYALTTKALEDIKTEIDKNRSETNYCMRAPSDDDECVISAGTARRHDFQESPKTAPVGQTQTQEYKELLEKYINVKSLCDVAQSNLKLLEDRQGGMLQQINDISKDRENILIEKTKLESALEQAEKEKQSIEKSKETFKRFFILACIVSVALLVLVLYAVVIR